MEAEVLQLFETHSVEEIKRMVKDTKLKIQQINQQLETSLLENRTLFLTDSNQIPIDYTSQLELDVNLELVAEDEFNTKEESLVFEQVITLHNVEETIDKFNSYLDSNSFLKGFQTLLYFSNLLNQINNFDKKFKYKFPLILKLPNLYHSLKLNLVDKLMLASFKALPSTELTTNLSILTLLNNYDLTQLFSNFMDSYLEQVFKQVGSTSFEPVDSLKGIVSNVYHKLNQLQPIWHQINLNFLFELVSENNTNPFAFDYNHFETSLPVKVEYLIANWFDKFLPRLVTEMQPTLDTKLATFQPIFNLVQFLVQSDLKIHHLQLADKLRSSLRPSLEGAVQRYIGNPITTFVFHTHRNNLTNQLVQLIYQWKLRIDQLQLQVKPFHYLDILQVDRLKRVLFQLVLELYDTTYAHIEKQMHNTDNNRLELGIHLGKQVEGIVKLMDTVKLELLTSNSVDQDQNLQSGWGKRTQQANPIQTLCFEPYYTQVQTRFQQGISVWQNTWDRGNLYCPVRNGLVGFIEDSGYEIPTTMSSTLLNQLFDLEGYIVEKMGLYYDQERLVFHLNQVFQPVQDPIISQIQSLTSSNFKLQLLLDLNVLQTSLQLPLTQPTDGIHLPSNTLQFVLSSSSLVLPNLIPEIEFNGDRSQFQTPYTLSMVPPCSRFNLVDT